jgi:hypothetical protein
LRPASAACAAWTLALLGAAACSSDKSSGTPAADTANAAEVATDAGLDDDAIPPGCECKPGAVLGCATDEDVLECGADCQTPTPRTCIDELKGNVTKCVLPGGCLQCLTGDRRCSPTDGQQVQECDDKGFWQNSKVCDSNLGQTCAAGTCGTQCDKNVKANSYIGCSFWAADLDNAFVPGGSGRAYFDASNAQYAIVVANPKSSMTAATVKISNNETDKIFDSEGQPLDTSPIQPGELRVFNLPPRNIDQTMIEPLAWRIDSNNPIAAYQFNPLANVGVYSNDASLLLPDELLGKEYYVMAREESFTILRAFMTVVATQPGQPTKVTVTISNTTGRTLASSNGKIASLDSKDKTKRSATFELKQWDVLNIETDEVGGDLTGTHVLADKRVAVFGGSEASNAPNTNHCNLDTCSGDERLSGSKCGKCEWNPKTPCNNNEDCSQYITCCADHLEMQMFPVKTWDSHYVAVKLWPRGQELDAWRIVAAKDGTKVALNPPQVDGNGKSINIPVLNAGEWFEFSPRRKESIVATGAYQKNANPAAGDCNFEILATDGSGKPAPIMVGHYMASQDAPEPSAQPYDAGTGDPAFLLAIPVAQWRQDFVFLVPDKYALNYVSIAAPIEKPGEPPVEVTVDGELVKPEQWTNIGKNFKFARLFVDPGTHAIAAVQPKDATGKSARGADGKPIARSIAVDVYGFDQYVSYGYPAGLDLKDVGLYKEQGEQ